MKNKIIELYVSGLTAAEIDEKLCADVCPYEELGEQQPENCNEDICSYCSHDKVEKIIDDYEDEY